MEPICSEPPMIGVFFSKACWSVHRNNAKLEEPRIYQDYEIVDGDYIKHFTAGDDVKTMVGASCFVPLGEPNHYSPISKNAPCYFLPVGTLLPDGLALVFTHEMNLRYPKHNKKDIRKAWHFAIVPTKLMTKDEYMDAVKELDWHVCEIKATAESDELVRDSDDMTGVKDFKIVELYRLMFIWHMQTADCMDRLYANSLHTWIALESPTLMEFLQDKARAGIVFSALVRMNTEDSVTLGTYKSDILNEIETAFEWDEEKFLAEIKTKIKKQESKNMTRLVKKWRKDQELVKQLIPQKANLIASQ